ncbi:hypothetical protein OKA05_27165 [Luteolibacter arcticus]|uniref:Uncharacterized protein n=1 Tax=Luteolibacter arcticus TaxID=1581411 RepID=A0ABT3GRV8_9BACT|nr:hypothetical protein [Luteolibacter arcticus]MCW1926264.1 hypothetical protein [Luteolibacter arcticus]
MPENVERRVTEALRVRITESAALTTTPQEAREWILQQAPQDASLLTGTMLAQMVEWHDFAGMSRFALQYGEESGSDEVLAAFLKSAPASSREEVLKLAEKIEDPGVRGEVTARFAR